MASEDPKPPYYVPPPPYVPNPNDRPDPRRKHVVPLLNLILDTLNGIPPGEPGAPGAPGAPGGPGGPGGIGAPVSGKTVNILVVSTAGASTATQLASGSVPILGGYVQNISQNNVTLGTSNKVAAGSGVILNAASSSGKGGGSAPLGPIDLSYLWWISSGASDSVVVYFITP